MIPIRLSHLHDFTKCIPYTVIGNGWYLLDGEVLYGPYDTEEKATEAQIHFTYSINLKGSELNLAI